MTQPTGDRLDGLLNFADNVLPIPPYINGAMPYVRNLLQSRVVGFGETHYGGRSLTSARCIREFVADFLIETHRRDAGRPLDPRRPRALALEFTEDHHLAVSFESSRIPASIQERVLSRSGRRVSGRTVERSIVNPRAYWMSTVAHHHINDSSISDMLLRIATNIPASSLYVGGIDAVEPSDGTMPELVRTPRLRPLPSYMDPNWGLAEKRDHAMVDRLGLLFERMAALDSDARREGRVFALLGAKHVSKASPSDPYDRDRDRGGIHPLGEFLLPSGRMHRLLPAVLRDNNLSFTAIEALNEALPPVWDSRLLDELRVAVPYLSEANIRNGAVRAYDLLASYFHSYNGGISVREFEQLLNRQGYPLVPPVSGDEDRVSVSRYYDHYIFFRRLGSWHPMDDLYFRSQMPLGISRPPRFYVPRDNYSLQQWEAEWSRAEEFVGQGDDLTIPGIFGVSQPVRRSEPATPSGGTAISTRTADYAPLGRTEEEWTSDQFYRRISFVFNRRCVVQGYVMIIGYGFLPRSGEPLPTEVRFYIRDQGREQNSTIAPWTLVRSDTIIIAQIPAIFPAGSRLGVVVSFPLETYSSLLRRPVRVRSWLDNAVELVTRSGP